MKKLKAVLKTIMNGLEFADAGEFLTSSQKTAYLDKAFGINPAIVKYNDEPLSSETDASAGTQRRIALYLGSELPEEMMQYVLQTCSHLQHGLTVITFETETTAGNLLSSYKRALADAKIDVKLKCLTGDPMARLKRYLRRHSEIAFLACKDTGYLAHNYLNSPESKNTLPVPIVVVVTKKGQVQQLPAIEVQEAGSKIA